MADDQTTDATTSAAEPATADVAGSSATATAAAPADGGDSPSRPLSPPATPDRGGFVWGTGRRKAAVARVRIKAGDGKFLINKREVDHYFTEVRDRNDITEPLRVTTTEGKVDVHVNVHGGGFMGQAGAIRLGLSRALKGYDPTLEQTLRDHNMLSRDPRRVERKKYGQPGARKRFQFSKR